MNWKKEVCRELARVYGFKQVKLRRNTDLIIPYYTIQAIGDVRRTSSTSIIWYLNARLHKYLWIAELSRLRKMAAYPDALRLDRVHALISHEAE